MNLILITNNILIYEEFKDNIDVEYKESFSYLDILYYTRNFIHRGHRLLTHPLSGSIKPNETPFKTIMISKTNSDLDFDSLKIIEESIQTAKKFLNLKNIPNWSDKVLDDFRYIDLSLIENVIHKINNEGS